MANMVIHSAALLFVILFYLHSSEAFLHKFRYGRDIEAAAHGSFAAVYPSINIWQRGTPAAQSSTPKSQPSSVAQSTGISTGTTLPISTLTSGKPPQSVPASANTSTPTSAQPDPSTTPPSITTPVPMPPQSSCTQTVLTRCTEIHSISTSQFANSSGSTVLTSTTTSCDTITTCNGPVTTVTATGPESAGLDIPLSNVPLIIFRNRNETDENAIKNFTQHLNDQVGASNVRTVTGTPELGIVFWTAKLNSSQVEEFNKSSVVSAIVEDRLLKTINLNPLNQTAEFFPPPKNAYTGGNSKRDDDSHAIRQSDALPQLRVVSQPHSVGSVDITTNFKYNSAAGSGITVYVLDTGANPENPEYALMPGSKRWIFAVDPDNRDAPETNTDPFNHGSCILSIIGGPLYGVAKKVDVVIVKIPMVDGYMVSSAVLDGLIKIAADIRENNLQGKAVLNMSIGFYFEASGFDMSELEYIAMLRDIISLDVPVVCSAGNAGLQNTPIDHFPAGYADRRYRLDSMIVVGATDNYGVPQPFSQRGDLLSLWAPGYDVVCASSYQETMTRLSGTSQAAPAVAGLAAYFMSMPEFHSEIYQQGQVARNVKNLIMKLAYPRHRRYRNIPVLWNQENSEDCIVRRDNSSANGCPGPSNSTSDGSTDPASSEPTSTAPISEQATTTSGGPLQTTHSDPPPPITFCSRISVPAKTMMDITSTATSFCTCNGGRKLGIGTTVGADHSTTYTCQAGPKTTIALYQGVFSD